MSLNNSEIKKLIDDLDLSMIANAMVAKLGWLPSEVKECCLLYKNYLYLKYKYPHEILAPSDDIDEFWHNHILDTKKYRADCEKIFGNYLDHCPYLDMKAKDSAEFFAKTQELHAKEFGCPISGVRYTKFSRLIRRFLGEI
jgi:hypothetical protein